MPKLRMRFVAVPLVLAATLFLVAACGSDDAADSAPDQGTNAAAAGSQPEPTDTMEEEAMEEEAMEEEAMEEEAMEEEAMEEEAMEEGAMEEEAMEEEAMEEEAMEEEAMEEEAMKDDAMAMSDGAFTLELSGVQPLSGGLHYEGWAIVDGQPVSTGKFNVDSTGTVLDLTGALKVEGMFHPGVDLEAASAVVITIEPEGDTDTVPSGTKYLAGDVNGGVATLLVSHPAAVGSDFAGSTGKYILATPTNEIGDDEKSGIWFFDLSSGSPAVGLDLPVLPDGWEYEGWAVIDGTPVSTGRFTAFDQVDSHSLHSGPGSGPEFPGEDFLVNAPEGLTFPVDLSGAAAVISVEPSPDDSPTPFALKPLIGQIPADATDRVTYMLEANEQPLATGTATIGSKEG